MSERPTNLNAADALTRLKEGNRRFLENQATHPRGDDARRQELVSGQRPFSIILGCADSRVAPELVFDEGLGDLFVIRVAGNIADDAVLGSIEYAVAHLGVNLVVVLGHQSCGAVNAAVENVDVQGPATQTHIDSLIDAIRPAVQAAREKGSDGLLLQSIHQNAKNVASAIAQSEPVLQGLATAGVKVVPAYYGLENGSVEFLD